jgi:hypothetical protein
MQAAVAARKWWARRRLGGPRGASDRTILRITTILLLVFGLAVIACAAIGLSDTARDDSRVEIARHAALQDALDELHAVFGDVDHFDAGQLRL